MYISQRLNEMTKKLDEIEKLTLKESQSRRDDFRRRIQHLRSSQSHIKSSFENFMRTRGKTSFEQQKYDLFNGVTIDNNDNYDLEMAENDSLNRSSKMVDDYVQIGQQTLHELYDQRDRLKGVQKGVLDIMNYLGISNTIIKTVEKREFIDKIIVFIGMIFIIFVLGFIFFYFRK